MFSAAAYLQKFGWDKGKGLGKNEDGLTKAISVTKKDDASGVGLKEDWTDRHTATYSKSLASINIVIEDDDSVAVFKRVDHSEVKVDLVHGGSFQRGKVLSEDPPSFTGKGATAPASAAPRNGAFMYSHRVKGKLARVQSQELAFSPLAPTAPAARISSTDQSNEGLPTEVEKEVDEEAEIAAKALRKLERRRTRKAEQMEQKETVETLDVTVEIENEEEAEEEAERAAAKALRKIERRRIRKADEQKEQEHEQEETVETKATEPRENESSQKKRRKLSVATATDLASDFIKNRAKKEK